MTTHDRDNEALVTFLQALAITITNLDEAAPEDRTAANFLRSLDGGIEAIVSMARQDGADIAEAVHVLRHNLTTALRQAKAGRQPPGRPH